MTAPVAVTVEMYIDGAWVDVTADVLFTDKVRITRGRTVEGDRVTAGTCAFTLKNTNGKYSNRNPSSTYYGKIGKNTPVRVKVGADVRFLGEAPRWAPRWDISENFAWVNIKASGIMQRLGKGARSLRSPLHRAIRAANPVAYWAMEEGGTASFAASALAGGTALTVSGASSYEFGGASDPPSGSAALTRFSGDGVILTGAITAPSDSDAWRAECTFRLSGTVAVPLFTLATTATQATDAVSWTLTANTTGTTLTLAYTDTVGAVTTYTASPTLAADEWHHISLDIYQAGAPAGVSVTLDGTTAISQAPVIVVGRPTGVRVAPTGLSSETLDLGHLAVWSQASQVVLTYSTYEAFLAYAGETAATRMTRLCAEEGVTFALSGNAADTALVGAQQIDTLLENLQFAASADQGVLLETRDVLGLTYRTRMSLYNQVPDLALDYTASQITTPFEPSDDDTYIHNDVTVSRPDGSSARAVLDVAELNHTLTTQDPPDGVGTYDRGSVTAHVEADDQLNDIAYWVRHLGTWDELRYPALTANLRGSAWTSDSALTADAAALDTGETITIDNLPVWLPPDLVQLQVQGYTETLTPFERMFTWNCTPGWPWEVWQLDTGGSTLALAVNSAATSLKLATSSGPEWSTTAEPYHIQIDGEAMTVTTMALATPAFIAAGTIAHGNNASVAPALPAGMTVDTAQILVCFAAIRNSGTGTVDLPSGWTSLVNFGNTRVFGKYYVTGDAAPTVTFTDGAANADTSARLFGFSGTSLEIDASATQLNGSAQDIAYPLLDVRRTNNVMLAFGWKQDDWTSVAALSGFTEMADNATTTGDDQGIVADYRLDTTPADLAAGSFSVTGGASAISRSILVALRPLQTATVTRSVNGVSKSLSATKAVNGWRLGVIAL